MVAIRRPRILQHKYLQNNEKYELSPVLCQKLNRITQ